MSEQASVVCSDFFMKSQSALILLLLLSKSQPLRWVVIWRRRFAAFFCFSEISLSPSFAVRRKRHITYNEFSCTASKFISRSFCRSSLPNRIRSAGSWFGPTSSQWFLYYRAREESGLRQPVQKAVDPNRIAGFFVCFQWGQLSASFQRAGGGVA